MSVNSSFFNGSAADSHDATSYLPFMVQMNCLRSKPSSILFTILGIIRIFLQLPLGVYILHLGLQRWKEKRSTSSPAPISNSDFFTYLAAVIALIDALGCIFTFTGIRIDNANIFAFGILLSFLVWYGEMYVNTLTCVERYLAVVHPITYLRHRNKIGIKIRNLICMCLFLSSLIGISLVSLGGAEALYAFCLLTLALTTVTFCTFSVLHTLIRPGPGEQAKNKQRIDPSKKRAFFTIVVIFLVLLLKFTYSVVWLVFYLKTDANSCLVLVCSFFFDMPSSLVLPVLFLHKTDKLICCRVSGFIKT